MTEHMPQADIHEDTLEELETGFGISFTPRVYKDSETLGGLFDGIWNELAPFASAGGRCPTTASFHQVKRAILNQCPDQAITPGMRLADIKGFEYAGLQDALRRKGWSTPIRYPRSRTWAIADGFIPHIWLLAVIAGMAAILPCPLPWFVAVPMSIVIMAAAFFSIALLRERCLFRKGLPVSDTVGELAQDIARRNLRRLRAEAQPD